VPLVIVISGFTQRTEALARPLWQQCSTDERTRCVTQIYDALMTEAVRCGGSVVSFAGKEMHMTSSGTSSTAHPKYSATS
jgi:hypothetical protein